MSNTFNFKRLLKYFKYDISNAKENYGLSLILWGCLPLIAYVVIQLFSLLVFRNGLVSFPPEVRMAFFYISNTGVLLTFGSKVYGPVTERKYGSNWTMVPASAIEKTVSLFVISCVILPVCLLAVFAASNGLICLMDPNSGQFLPDFNPGGLFNNMSGIFFLNWTTTVLAFTLGALFFRKRKIAKTLLCTFVVTFLFLILTVLIFGKSHISGEEIDEFFNDAEFFVNLILNVLYFLITAVLVIGTYFRIKRIKY